MSNIKVVNVRNYQGENMLYIGRKNVSWGFEESVLKNMNRLGGMNRDESVERYRVWLWGEVKKKGVVYDELVRLVNKLKKGEEVILGCWCFPKKCHGDIVKGCLEWMLKK